MPLDSGAVTKVSSGTAEAELGGPFANVASAFGAGPNIGAAFRLAREFRGYTLQDLAEATRIRRSYLAALEAMELNKLPSRPFSTGYVRAAAQALGLDPNDAIARFNREAPDAAEPLRAPVGVSHERDPRLSLAAGAAGLVVCAVLVWNLAQHATAKDRQPAPAVPEIAANAPAAAGPKGAVVLSQPLPPPMESQGPAPYVTPGLAQAAAAAEAAANGLPPPEAVEAAVPPPTAPPLPPNPRAAVFGASSNQSAVTLQARKPVSLIVRGADGSVYFARQLAAGEAYRAPMLGGLTLDVSDPAAFDVYANGAFKGQLEAPQTLLAKLVG